MGLLDVNALASGFSITFSFNVLAAIVLGMLLGVVVGGDPGYKGHNGHCHTPSLRSIF